MRLPTLLVVAVHLHMSDRIAERCAAGMADRELGDFVVEIDKSLDDDLPLAGTSAFLGIGPGLGDVAFCFHSALTFSGAAHDRLNHTWQADLGNGGAIGFLGVGKAIGGGFEPEFLGSKPPDAFTVHCQLRRSRIRDHGGHPLGFQCRQRVGSNRFDLRNHKMGSLGFDHCAKSIAIQHRQHMRSVGHLHGWGIRVGINSDHFDAIALEFDHDLLTQFAGAAQKDLGCRGGKGGADLCHHFEIPEPGCIEKWICAIYAGSACPLGTAFL